MYVLFFDFMKIAVQTVETTSGRAHATNHNFEDAHNMEKAIETMAKAQRPTSPRTTTATQKANPFNTKTML